MAHPTTTRIALLAPEILQSEDNFTLWTIQCPANRRLRVDPRSTRRTTPKRSSHRDDRSKREGTLPLEGKGRSFDATADPYLELCFDQKRNSRHGIVLGTAEDCDVRIPRDDDRGRPVKGVSRHHCAITFDRYNRLIIKDFSSNGTIVWYGSQGGQRRKDFTWIVSGHEVADANELTIEIGMLLRFQLIVPSHDLLSRAYVENVRRFLTGAAAVQSGDNIRFGGLEILSTADTASGTGMHTPVQGPIYITEGLLGEGAFSQVRKIWNVSTGREYAGKVPLNRLERRMLDDEARLMKMLTHVGPFPYLWLVRSLLTPKKDHIVPFRDFTYDPEPMMVLEYAPCGTLKDMMDQDMVSKTQCVEIMSQALSALSFLHSFDQPVVHRDIKPANILIKSKEPLHIWLADFGFSKASVELTTVCGTPLYKAAEVHKGTYTAAVDIWSLGVVALEIAYGIPTWIAGDPMEWCRALARKARHLSSDPLAELIRPMLLMDPEARPSASMCSRASLRIRLPLEPPVASAKSPPKSNPKSESSGLPSYNVSTLKRPATSRSSSQSTPRQTQRPRQFSEDSDPLAEAWDEDDLFGGNWLANSMVVGSAVAAMGRESEWSSSNLSSQASQVRRTSSSHPPVPSNPSSRASQVPQTSSSHQPVPPRRSARLSQKQVAPATSSEQRMGQYLLRAVKE
ncbi:Serine/threonine-protein kinase RAD53 [Tolypocladium paradoxum]|uniref:Autophagy-related protein 1 n=1 Tax=Tolypocladium paradoxum TaxID=94208 RepID=A0A2S4L369_9HYPO|nr:Serine/threonine-protein kinase RAD53 [Tolypocladium paradoxum]